MLLKLDSFLVEAGLATGFCSPSSSDASDLNGVPSELSPDDESNLDSSSLCSVGLTLFSFYGVGLLDKKGVDSVTIEFGVDLILFYLFGFFIFSSVFYF